MDKRIFKAYDIRGVYPSELDEEIFRKLGVAFGNIFGKKIVVGGDYRTSTPSLKKNFIEGLIAAGCEVIDIGSVPTPVLIFSIKFLGVDGGISVTASHNPKEYNGLKFFDSGAIPIVRDGGYNKLMKIVENGGLRENGFGSLKKTDVVPAYLDFVVRACGLASLKGKKIVTDCGNGAAGPVYPQALKMLGAEVVELYSEPDGTFPNHPADPSHSENLQDLVKKVLEIRADFGFGFDGDGDRLGVVDRNGKILETILVFSVLINRCMKEHAGSGVVYDALTSQRVQDIIKIKGGTPLVCRVGHPFIMRKMVEQRAWLAGELSGHYYHLQQSYSDDDALFGALKFLCELESGKTLEQYEAEIPKYFSAVSEEQRILVNADLKWEFIEGLEKRFRAEGRKLDMLDGVKVLFSHGWAIFRPSNTEPKIAYAYESSDKKEFSEIKEFVENILKEAPRQ